MLQGFVRNDGWECVEIEKCGNGTIESSSESPSESPIDKSHMPIIVDRDYSMYDYVVADSAGTTSPSSLMIFGVTLILSILRRFV